MRIKARLHKAQALTELLIGMFALALLISAIIVFSQYFLKSLKLENNLRSMKKEFTNLKVELDEFSRKNLFETEKRSLKINEPFRNIDRTIPSGK